MKHRSMSVLAVLCACMLFAPAHKAAATHFRFGNIYWHATGVPNQVEFKLRVAYRADYPLFGNPPLGATIQADATFNFGDGSQVVNPNALVVAKSSPAENWLIAEITLLKTYAGAGPYTASFNGCCRLSTLNNGHDEPYLVSTIVRPNTTERPPISLLVPIITVAPGAASTFTVPAIDEDNDPIRFRLATPAEAGGRANPPNIAINPTTGTVTWNTTGLNTTNPWTLQVIIEDLTSLGAVKSQTPVDFLLKIGTPVGTAPTIALAPAGVQKVNPGTNIAYTVTATDPDAGAVLSLSNTPLPAGAVLGASLPGPSPRTQNFSWTPTPAQYGSYIIGHSVVDENGQQAVAYKTLVVNRPPTANAGADITEECTGAPMGVTLSGSGSDPDNDPLTFTWKEGAVTLGTGATLAASFAVGVHSITLEVSDGTATTTSTMTVTITDTQAPVPDVASLPNVTGECSATIASAPTATDACGGTITGTTSDPLSYSAQGTYTVTWTYDDGNGNTSSQTQAVIVKDVTPPVIVLMPAASMWPVNHQMVSFSLTQMVASATDNCQLTGLFISKITSDESSTAVGTGGTPVDINVLDCSTVQLRRERAGTGNGRVYTVYITATDIGGNSTTVQYHVSVPHNVNGLAVQDGDADVVVTSCPSPAKNAPAAEVQPQIVLGQNYPNPFNPSTSIDYTLPADGAATMRVYTMDGRQVATLVDGMQTAGTHTVSFDASVLPSGLYVYRLEQNGAVASRTLQLLK